MTRPTHWYGTDAPKGGIELDWEMIDEVASELDVLSDQMGAVHIHNFFCQVAIQANKDGDLEACGVFASMGMAALNYWVCEDHPDFDPTDSQMMSAFGTKWHDKV